MDEEDIWKILDQHAQREREFLRTCKPVQEKRQERGKKFSRLKKTKAARDALLQAGAQPDDKNSLGHTPLHVAAYRGTRVGLYPFSQKLIVSIALLALYLGLHNRSFMPLA